MSRHTTWTADQDGCQPMVLHPRVVTGSGGGPDKTILNSPRFLSRYGYRSACLYLRPPGDSGFESLRQRALQWNAPLEEIDDRGVTDWRVVGRALEACRRLQVKIWHGHDYKTNLLGLLLRRWHPMKLVTTVHGWVHHTAKTSLYYKLDRWAIRQYDRVVCVSPDLLDECRGFGVLEERSELIENAIDTGQFQRRRGRKEAKLALGLPDDRFVIGAVGRLSPEKGFDLLIRSVEALRGRGHDPLLVILGDGDELRTLSSLVDKLGMQDVVRLVGFQSDTIAWYEAMDVYALSSLREGLPNVVLEAMALETPVVATAVAGVPRVIENDKSGLVVPIDDVVALTEALDRTICEPGLRERLAGAARQVVEGRYSFAKRMERIVQAYKAVGAGPTTTPTRQG